MRKRLLEKQFISLQNHDIPATTALKYGCEMKLYDDNAAVLESSPTLKQVRAQIEMTLSSHKNSFKGLNFGLQMLMIMIAAKLVKYNNLEKNIYSGT